MAIIETGLGWYADGEWLKDTAGTVAELVSGGGGSTFPGQPIPVFEMTAQNYQNGFLFATTNYASSVEYRYISVSAGEAYIAYSSDAFTNVFCKSRVTFYVYEYFVPTSGSPYGYGPYVQSMGNNKYGDWYYSSGSYLTASGNIIPRFGNLGAVVTALNNLGSTTTYDKSAAGYSVVCLCKWRESIDGDILVSPILISTINANTNWTVNGSVPIQQLTEHSFQGETFLMRLYKSHIYDPNEVASSSFPIKDYSESVPLNANTLFATIASQSSLGVGYPPQDEDPYEDGGTSEPGGGTPDFTETSDAISPTVSLPISFQSTGLCRVYIPTLSDLNDLADYLWTDQTFLDTVKNILIQQFENFMQAVISLSMIPCQVPTGARQAVKVMFIPTGLTFPPATEQFVEVDCGTLDITERYGSALDYNPYTKISLYLPFIGTVPLDTDEVMGKTIGCKYLIDIVSGACVAKITVSGYSGGASGVMYQFSGHCSISMPLTSADFSSYYAAAMTGLKMATGMVAAGAGAPALAGAMLGEPMPHPSSVSTTTKTTTRNPATGRQVTAGTTQQNTVRTPGSASFSELAVKAAGNTVGSVINSKFSVEHSGGFTGNTGFLGVQQPYVIITRPDMCNPEEYGSYHGRPSMMYLSLGTLSGFTQVQNIKLTGFSATNPEMGEISELLKSGVIL